MAKERLSSYERKARIVESASNLFSEKGFRGTTTKEIANQAGISEGMIFRHFPTKKELYSAILQQKIGEEKDKGYFSDKAAEQRNDRVLLETIGQYLIEKNEKDPSFIRLLLFSALEGHELSEMFYQSEVTKLNSDLTEYFRQRIEEGAFKKITPEIMARSFIGMIAHYILMRQIFDEKSLLQFSPRTFLRSCIGIFLDGVKQECNAKAGANRRENEIPLRSSCERGR